MFGIDISILIAIPFVFILYFLPTFIAYHRKHGKKLAIRTLNLLAGWTFIGWVICAIWAYADDGRKRIQN